MPMYKMTSFWFSAKISQLTYLKDDGLIVLFEIEGKHIGIHEGLPTLAEHVDCFLQELYLDP